jgi:hypothetical protein
MKTIIAILAVAFLAVSPAAAKSAESYAPGHHAKKLHGASYYAPGHAKKHMYMQSANPVAPGHRKHATPATNR